MVLHEANKSSTIHYKLPKKKQLICYINYHMTAFALI